MMVGCRYLKKWSKPGSKPADKRKPGQCKCVLLDTASFGSQRDGVRGHNGIPGRVVNDCTGNYVDLFTVMPFGSYKGEAQWLSSPLPSTMPAAALLPLETWSLDLSLALVQV